MFFLLTEQSIIIGARVTWINKAVARSSLDQDLKGSISANSYGLSAEGQKDAEERLRAIAKGFQPPNGNVG